MGSGEAKKFRDLYGSAGRHGQSFWEEEKDNVGMKLLRGMGWESGQGLGKDGSGRTDAVKQFRKKDNAGIGSKAGTRDEAFKGTQDLFNDVLSRLACGGGSGEGEAPAAPILGAAANTVKGVMARRQMTRRFVRSKEVHVPPHRSRPSPRPTPAWACAQPEPTAARAPVSPISPGPARARREARQSRALAGWRPAT